MNNLFNKKNRKEKPEKSGGTARFLNNVTQIFGVNNSGTNAAGGTDSFAAQRAAKSKKYIAPSSISPPTVEELNIDGDGNGEEESFSPRTGMDFERSAMKIEPKTPGGGRKAVLPKTSGDSRKSSVDTLRRPSQEGYGSADSGTQWNKQPSLASVNVPRQSMDGAETIEVPVLKTASFSQLPTHSLPKGTSMRISGKINVPGSAPTTVPNSPMLSATTSDVDIKSLHLSTASTPTQRNVEVHAQLPAVDDENRDYIVRNGELFYGRYVLGSVLGQGSFGRVLKAFDVIRNEYVAVKIVRSGSPYYEQSLSEVNMTTYLNGKPGVKKAHVMEILNKFVYKGHQCLVFELLSFSLYDLLRSTDFYGISMKLVKQFGKQILTCLEWLSSPEVGVIHSDLKPENVLLQHAQRTEITVVDFGSSIYETDNLTLYIQSRFYRAPEVHGTFQAEFAPNNTSAFFARAVILGFVPYDGSIDIWSLGCLLLELHVGYAAFPGQSEGDQMALIVEKLGIPPAHVLDAGSKTENFFHRDASGLWKLNEGLAFRDDPNVVPESLPIRAFVEEMSVGVDSRRRQSTAEDLELFFDLIDKMLHYDPQQRISPQAALQHPFFSSSKKRGGRDHSPSAVMNVGGDMQKGTHANEDLKQSGRAAPVQKIESQENEDAENLGKSDSSSLLYKQLSGMESTGTGSKEGSVFGKDMGDEHKKMDSSWKEEVGIQRPLWRDLTLIPDPRREENLNNALRGSLHFQATLGRSRDAKRHRRVAQNSIVPARFSMPDRGMVDPLPPSGHAGRALGNAQSGVLPRMAIV